jgi:hypothetical protein
MMEIPVVERPVIFRAVGQRQAAASGASRPQPREAAAVRATPRVVMQAGVRVFRGS